MAFKKLQVCGIITNISNVYTNSDWNPLPHSVGDIHVHTFVTDVTDNSFPDVELGKEITVLTSWTNDNISGRGSCMLTLSVVYINKVVLLT